MTSRRINSEQDDLAREAEKIRRLSRKYGAATLVIDSQGMFHTFPGPAEIIGHYDDSVELKNLSEDLSVG